MESQKRSHQQNFQGGVTPQPFGSTITRLIKFLEGYLIGKHRKM